MRLRQIRVGDQCMLCWNIQLCCFTSALVHSYWIFRSQKIIILTHNANTKRTIVAGHSTLPDQIHFGNLRNFESYCIILPHSKTSDWICCTNWIGWAKTVWWMRYCWWKKSQTTTWHVWNPVNNAIFTISTGWPDFFHQQYHINLWGIFSWEPGCTPAIHSSTAAPEKKKTTLPCHASDWRDGDGDDFFASLPKSNHQREFEWTCFTKCLFCTM